jgi:hypothetical protein
VRKPFPSLKAQTGCREGQSKEAHQSSNLRINSQIPPAICPLQILPRVYSGSWHGTNMQTSSHHIIAIYRKIMSTNPSILILHRNLQGQTRLRRAGREEVPQSSNL